MNETGTIKIKEKIRESIEKNQDIPQSLKKAMTDIVLEPERFLLLEVLKIYESSESAAEKLRALALLTEIKKSRLKPALFRVLDQSDAVGGF